MPTDVIADIVADVVAATRKGSVVYSRNRFHAPWGIGVPTGTLASVHVVTSGACWLLPDGGTPIHLTRGDVALVPAGIGHAIADAPDRPVRPLPELRGYTEEYVIEGPGPLTGLVCGGFLMDPTSRHPLTTMLPPTLHVAAGQARGTGLAAAVDLLCDEVDRADPGAPAVIATLIDLLFVYVLRAWLRTTREGWSHALHDPTVGAALALVHRSPAHPWTVAALSRAVAVPRATFSRRFTALTGLSPMAYVTAWRMTVAARLLRENDAPLREIAGRVGYDSEFAFARAFKRVTGRAPGQYRISSRS